MTRVLDNLEEVFVTSDVGVDTTLRIIDRIQKRVARDKYVGSSELNRLLCEEISDMLAEKSEAPRWTILPFRPHISRM